MIHAVILAGALAGASPDTSAFTISPAARCLSSMDGAVYHGDPADRRLMRANVAACHSGVVQIERIHASRSQGPQKLFLLARLLDRSATLTYIGLGDALSALADVKTANLYFRVAASLAEQSADYHEAALASCTLTAIQLATLHTDIAAAERGRRPAPIALTPHSRRNRTRSVGR